MKLSQYLLSQPFKKDSNDLEMIYSTRTNALLAVDSETWVALQSNQLERISDENLEYLFSQGILTNDHHELTTVITENIHQTQNETEGYFAVQVTASCQFGCTYCGQTHGPKKYNADDINEVARFIVDQLRANSLESLKLGLFGGEPLLALRQNLDLVRKLKELLGQDFPIRSKMATNGLRLNAETLEVLRDEAGLFTTDITLDGPAHIHDQRRMLKNGKGTFEQIWKNLEQVHHLVSEDFKINIRMNVDSESVDAIRDFLLFLSQHAWTKKMTLYFAPVHSWGNDADLRIREKEKLSLQLLELRVQAVSLGLKIDGFIAKRTYKACMAMDGRSLVIDPSKKIFTCTEVPLVKSYELRRHQARSGDIQNYQRSDYRGFYDEVLRGEWPCAKCPLFPACGGACPKSWKEGRPACPPLKGTIQATLQHLSKLVFKADEVTA